MKLLTVLAVLVAVAIVGSTYLAVRGRGLGESVVYRYDPKTQMCFAELGLSDVWVECTPAVLAETSTAVAPRVLR